MKTGMNMVREAEKSNPPRSCTCLGATTVTNREARKDPDTSTTRRSDVIQADSLSPAVARLSEHFDRARDAML